MVIWYYMACWDIMTYNDTQNLDETIWKVGNLGLTWKKLFVPSWKHVSTFLGGCYNDTWCCFSREKWTVQLAHDGCIFWTGKLILILSCHVRFPSGPGGFFWFPKPARDRNSGCTWLMSCSCVYGSGAELGCQGWSRAEFQPSSEPQLGLAGLAWCSFNWLIFNIIQQQSIEWNSKA